jgi:hypothetical protein
MNLLKEWLEEQTHLSNSTLLIICCYGFADASLWPGCFIHRDAMLRGPGC